MGKGEGKKVTDDLELGLPVGPVAATVEEAPPITIPRRPNPGKLNISSRV